MKPVNVKLSKPPQFSFKYKKIELASLEFNWHYHPEYEIMLMHGSKGKRFIGDSIANYQEGDLFFIGPNLPHAWYSPTGVMGQRKKHRAILIQFGEKFAGLNVRQIPELVSVYRLMSHASRGLQFHGHVRQIIGRRMLQMQKLSGIDRLISLLKILDILAKADKSEREELSSADFNTRLQAEDQSRIDQICTYINKNYKKQLRLENVASIANLSTTAFSRFFKKSTGKTFVNYLNELRIGWACRLLIETEQTIAEICYEVGFNNLSNFNRQFFDRHKMSPRQYRRAFTPKY